jgi:O-antigen ligase
MYIGNVMLLVLNLPLVSIFVSSANSALEGTRQFRLQWWTRIIEYTVLGPYFWTGKGFGVNLADDDGFQPTADRSLRAPHNSHMTTLARMGVPGFVLWVALQLAFAVSLLRAILAHRRAGTTLLAVAGGILLVYWLATNVNTSFDPYLEGPQNGI